MSLCQLTVLKACLLSDKMSDKAIYGWKDFFWLLAQGYCPSWQGSHARRIWKQLVMLYPHSESRDGAGIGFGFFL